MELYQRLDEGIGLNYYLRGPLDVSTQLKVIFRTADLDLKERRERLRKMCEDGDMFKNDCSSGCEDRIHIGGACAI